MLRTDRLRRPLALLLAGGSLAVGVPAALAAGGTDPSAATTTTPVQQQDEQPAPKEDCPERDGRDGSGSGSGGDAGATGSSTPEPAV